jgi:hypothetical protein
MRKKPQIKFNTLYIKDKKPLGKVAFIFPTVQKTVRVDDGGAKTRQREISPSVSTKTPASQRERWRGRKVAAAGHQFSRAVCVCVGPAALAGEKQKAAICSTNSSYFGGLLCERGGGGAMFIAVRCICATRKIRNTAPVVVNPHLLGCCSSIARFISRALQQPAVCAVERAAAAPPRQLSRPRDL